MILSIEEIMNYILVASRPPVDGPIKLCVLALRNVSNILYPTIPPILPFRSPFLGHSLEQIRAAFVGTDRPTGGEPAGPIPAPIRRSAREDEGDKCRVWCVIPAIGILDVVAALNRPSELGAKTCFRARHVFVVLDDGTLDTEDPTAMIVYISGDDSSAIHKVRSDIRTLVRCVAALEVDQFDVPYAIKNLTDSKGVVRQENWEEWLGEGGPGMTELGIPTLGKL